MKSKILRSLSSRLLRRFPGSGSSARGRVAPLLAAALVLVPGMASAASIVWSGPQNITGDADVFQGRIVTGAFEVGGPGPGNIGGIVNGTNFSPIAFNFTPSVTVGNFTFTASSALLFNNAVGFPAPPYSNLSKGYQSILSSIGGIAANTPLNLTMRGLTVGRIYTFQWWANDSFAGAGSIKESATAGGTSGILSINPSDQAGGVGQFATGTFVADSPTQTVQFVSNFESFLNAFQLVEGGHATYQGNFKQKPSSVLSLVLASPTNFDSLTVRGKAHLSGTLNLALSNGFVPSRGDKFTVIQSTGLSGQYSKVTAPVFNFLTLRPFYGQDDLTVRVVVNSFAALPGLSLNERAVARNLDTVIYDARETELLGYLYNQKLSNLPKEYDRISPEGLTSIFTMSTAYAQVQSLNLQRRMDDIRTGSNGFTAAGLAINGVTPSYSGAFNVGTGVAGPSGNDGKESKAVKNVVMPEDRWGAFLSGTGEWVNVSGTDNARGYFMSSGGFTLGVDYKVAPNFAIGLAGGYVGTTVDLTERGRVWMNGGKLGLYATWFQNEPVAAAPKMSKDSSKGATEVAPPASEARGWYIDLAAFGGYNSYDTRRTGVNGQARGDTDGGEVNALFGTGYDLKSGGVTFGPTATFNYTYAGVNGFTEHNSLAPLDIRGGDADSLRMALGVKASCECKLAGMTLKPELRLAWQHEFGDSTYSLDSSLANGGGGTFTVSGPRFGRDSLLVGAGCALEITPRCATYLYYDGELLRENYVSNAVTGGVRIAF
jgi:outer membrane autotransporter protein